MGNLFDRVDQYVPPHLIHVGQPLLLKETDGPRDVRLGEPCRPGNPSDRRPILLSEDAEHPINRTYALRLSTIRPAPLYVAMVPGHDLPSGPVVKPVSKPPEYLSGPVALILRKAPDTYPVKPLPGAGHDQVAIPVDEKGACPVGSGNHVAHPGSGNDLGQVDRAGKIKRPYRLRWPHRVQAENLRAQGGLFHAPSPPSLERRPPHPPSS